MALEYFLYRTDYNNTLIDRSESAFSLGANEGQIQIDFLLPKGQALYLYRESGSTIVENDQSTINNYLSVFDPPDSNGNVKQGIFTGYTATTNTRINNLDSGLVDLSGKTKQYDGVDTEANILALDPSLYLGELWYARDIDTDYISFTVSTTGENKWIPNRIQYDSVTDTFKLGNTADGQTQNLGQEIFINCHNESSVSGTTLNPKVFIITTVHDGLNGEFYDAQAAVAGDVGINATYGINTTEANVGDYFKLSTYGQINGVDTSAWVVDTILYLSESNSGELTNIKPSNNPIVIGIVKAQDAVNGKLFVNTIRQPKELISTIPLSFTFLYFTGDQVSGVTGTTKYQILPSNKGVADSLILTETVANNTRSEISNEFLTPIVSGTPTLYSAGIYDSQIELGINSSASNEKVYVEIYIANSGGTAIDSGISGQTNGFTYPVRPFAKLQSSLLKLSDTVINSVNVSGFLLEDVALEIGQRLKVVISVEKIGTVGGDKEFTLYFGSDYNSFLRTPFLPSINELRDVNTDGVTNNQVIKYNSVGGVWTASNVQIGEVTNLQTNLDDINNDITYISGVTDTKLESSEFTGYTATTDSRIGDIESDVIVISGDVTQNTSDITYISGITDTKLNTISFNDYSGTTKLAVDNNLDILSDTLNGGLISGGTLSPIGGLNFMISAGRGLVKNPNTGDILILEWGVLTGSTTIGGDNFIAIDYQGNVVITDEYGSADNVRVGYFRTDGGNNVIVGFSSVSYKISNSQYNKELWLSRTIGTLIEDGLPLSFQSPPNGLKIIRGSGILWTTYNRIELGESSGLTKIYDTADGNIINTNNPNEIDVEQWNDVTQTGTSALVTMTSGYFKKDLIGTTPEGTNIYLYGTAEYPTEELAIDAPLPQIPPSIKNQVAKLSSIIVEQGTTGITTTFDLRPIFSRLFGGSFASAPITAVDHGDLIGLENDDHLQYLTNTRGDIRYQNQINNRLLKTTFSSYSATTENLINAASNGGVLYGLTLSATSDTEYTISSGAAQLIDINHDTGEITKDIVVYSGGTFTPTGLTAQSITYVAISREGEIIESPFRFTSEIKKDINELGTVSHPNFSTISFVFSRPEIPYDAISQLADAQDFLKIAKFNGNDFSIVPSANTLSFSISEGSIYRRGSNYNNNKDSADVVVFSGKTPADFYYINQFGSIISGVTNVISPDVYEEPITGNQLPITGNSNQATINRIWTVESGRIFIQRGQKLYGSIGDATANLSIDIRDHINAPSLVDTGLLLGCIIVRASASNLGNIRDAISIQTDKLGNIYSTSASDVFTFQNTEIISSKESFPRPNESDDIILQDNITYLINGTINLGTSRLVLGSNTLISGNNISTDIIVGSRADELIAGTNKSVVISLLTLRNFNTSGNIFDLVGNGSENCIIRQCIISSCGMGNILNYNLLQVNNCLFTDMYDGWFVSGSTVGSQQGTKFILSNCIFENPALDPITYLTIPESHFSLISFYTNFFEMKTSGVTGVNVISGATTSSGKISENAFVSSGETATGNAIVGVTSQTPKWRLNDNVGLASGAITANNFGYFEIRNNTTATVINNTNTFTKITYGVGTTTNSTFVNFSLPTENQLTYTGDLNGVVFIFLITGDLFVNSNNQTISVAVYLNDTTLLVQQEVRTQTSGISYPFALNGIATLDVNDYLSIYVENQTQVRDIVVRNSRLRINEP